MGLKILKRRIEKENSKSAAELFKEEQSKLIEELVDMELVAKSLPQLAEIASGLYKHKSKLKESIKCVKTKLESLFYFIIIK
jgi:hypothetical protein